MSIGSKGTVIDLFSAVTIEDRESRIIIAPYSLVGAVYLTRITRCKRFGFIFHKPF